jgi:hypothetical protein
MSYQWLPAAVETPIVELRRYRLHPGRREDLVGLFERALIEPQEAAGARILGTFALEDDPDCFVWLRGFVDMEQRREALMSFYGGPVWQIHRDAANATMADSDDVHLLRAVRPQGGLPPLRLPRIGQAQAEGRYTLLVSELRFEEGLGDYHLWLRLFLRKAAAPPLASFMTLAADNDYRALPVWRNRPVHVALLPGTPAIPPLPRELATRLRRPPEALRLVPTARSRLR